MKLSFMFMLMIISTCTVQSFKSTDCEQKNPFLIGLRKKAVMIHQQPQKEPAICAGEWQSYGTCCEIKSVAEYAARDAGDVKTYVEQLIEEMDILKITVINIMDTLKSINNIYDRSASIEFKTAEVKAKVLFLRSLNSKIDDVRAVFNTIVQIEDEMRKQQTRCATKMNRMRSSALCTTCSGRSQEYFYLGKAAVSEASCNEFVEDCFDAWTMLIQIMNGMKKGVEYSNEIKAVFQSFPLPMSTVSLQSFEDWMLATHLDSNIRACGASAATCTQTTRNSICDNVLNLLQPTFLENVVTLSNYQIMKKYSKSIQSLRSSSRDYMIKLLRELQRGMKVEEKQGTLLGNWNVSRRLQASADQQPASPFKTANMPPTNQASFFALSTAALPAFAVSGITTSDTAVVPETRFKSGELAPLKPFDFNTMFP